MNAGVRGLLQRLFRRPIGGDLAVIAKLWLIAAAMLAIGLFFVASAAIAMPLSAGDRIRLLVHEGAEFSGKFQIGVEGEVALPYVGPVRLAGLEPREAQRALDEALETAGIIRAGVGRTALQVLEWAPIDVAVAGAVYLPGSTKLNMPPSRDRAPDRPEELPGARLPERFLSDALRGAGGVRPDAQVSAIQVVRGGRSQTFDLSGLFSGKRWDDVALVAGDTVIVPFAREEDAAIARPSRITPPGVRVFVSNLTTPALHNNASTVDNGALSFAYGSRMSQAVVAANCAGGAVTNSSRKALLVRTDRVSGGTRTWESRVEELIRDPRREANPVLQESDGLVCYDSTTTNVREIFRTLGDILLPFRSPTLQIR